MEKMETMEKEKIEFTHVIVNTTGLYVGVRVGDRCRFIEGPTPYNMEIELRDGSKINNIVQDWQICPIIKSAEYASPSDRHLFEVRIVSDSVDGDYPWKRKNWRINTERLFEQVGKIYGTSKMSMIPVVNCEAPSSILFTPGVTKSIGKHTCVKITKEDVKNSLRLYAMDMYKEFMGNSENPDLDLAKGFRDAIGVANSFSQITKDCIAFMTCEEDWIYLSKQNFLLQLYQDMEEKGAEWMILEVICAFKETVTPKEQWTVDMKKGYETASIIKDRWCYKVKRAEPFRTGVKVGDPVRVNTVVNRKSLGVEVWTPTERIVQVCGIEDIELITETESVDELAKEWDKADFDKLGAEGYHYVVTGFGEDKVFSDIVSEGDLARIVGFEDDDDYIALDVVCDSDESLVRQYVDRGELQGYAITKIKEMW